MRLPRPLFWLARMYFGCFFLLTSAYCLLAYVPFTYHDLLKAADLLPWLTAFARFHSYLYWTALASAGVTLLDDLRRPSVRPFVQAFLVCHIVFGVLLQIHPLLPNLQNDEKSLDWGMAALIPLAWVAVIDVAAAFSLVRWREPEPGEERALFRVSWQSALFVSLLYAGLFEARIMFSATDVPIWSYDWLWLLGWSILSHLIIFMGLFAALCLIRALGGWSARPARMEFLLLNLPGVFILYRLLQGKAVHAIFFAGPAATIYSIALAITLMAFLSGLGIRLCTLVEEAAMSGLDVQLAALTIYPRPEWFARWISMPLICVLAYELSVHSAEMDWNYLFQKLTAVVLWTVTFAALYGARSRLAMGKGRIFLIWVAPLAVLGAYKSVRASELPVGAIAREQYASYNPSFKLAGDILARPPAQSSFFRFLIENSNISASTRVDPVDIKLAPMAVSVLTPKPNIFILVVDSLRQDYLSPYNGAVHFTPAVESFARESVVMKNAFTRYGGTGLSEPALWVGGMLLHKQYILPFAPMNALAKLITAERYRSYISSDTILSTIAAPSLAFTELDRGVLNMNYDLCNSLHDLESKVLGRRPEHGPVFAYTQPQNLHISVIQREKKGVPAGESYPGFNAPYASRVKQIDRCFGEFIDFLKLHELYDHSIVVLTSDHGDSLGEDGRWGHAYTIFPEIIRIPMILHLPPGVGKGLTIDRNAVAFLTDITPTLYYLLGHRPIQPNPVFGRPLFTITAGEQARYRRESYLLASSYAAVYGLLSDSARQLYIVDAVNFKRYLYDLTTPAGNIRPLNAQIQAERETQIREHINEIGRFYRFGTK